MTKTVPIYIALIVCLCLVSCGAEVNMKKGEKLWQLGEYFSAAEQFKKAYTKTPSKERETRAKAAIYMAHCYEKINFTPKSISAFNNALRYGFVSNNDKLALALQLLKAGNYKTALEYLEVLADSMPNNKLVANALTSAKWALQPKKDTIHYQVKRMDVFNSRRADYAPMLMNGETDKLFFSSTRNEATGEDLNNITGTKNSDIFVSELNDKGNWSKPEPLHAALNTVNDEGACCFSPDNKTLYFTQCVTDPLFPRYAQIMSCSRSDASWGSPSNVTITRDSLSTYAHPAVSPDGQWLYFSSDMPGGKGGFDLWRARLMSAGVSFIENLGEPINTQGNEFFPCFRPNGDLYFASNGHIGLGGLDLYVAKIDLNNKVFVEHLPAPMNSSADDFGITFEGLKNKGFFSSNRNDARGYDHIYSFEREEIVQSIKGWVYEAEGYELPAAQVSVIGDNGTNKTVNLKLDGSFTIEVEPNVNYLLMASCKGFLNHTEELFVPKLLQSKEYVLQFPLASITAPVLIDNIFYDFDKASLRPESTKALDELVKLLNENPNITIELSSHTDFRGGVEYNKILSQKRAESVVNYLVSKGIASERLTPVGYGKDKAKVVRKKLAEKYNWLKENDVLTEELIVKFDKEKQEICNQLNRRTEFIVLRTTYGLFDEKGNIKLKNMPKKTNTSIKNDDVFDITF